MPGTAQSPPPALELRGFGVSFGARVILACVDLMLPAQGVDVLMGPVKTGKSTLVRSIAGLNRHNVLFRSWGDATLLGRTADEDWRPMLVQQHASTLSANVGAAVVHHARQLVERSPGAWLAHAHDSLCRFGLSMLADAPQQPMMSLPPAQQRAVNILAHALADPPLLIVDEPTYGLDEQAAAWLVEWLARLGQAHRLVVVLHHQGQARRLADRIILLGGGRVLAHEETGYFFKGRVNAWVDQFTSTGSLSIASPDAKPEELGPDVEPPPPLPAAALAAIAALRPPAQAIVAPEEIASRVAPVHTAGIAAPDAAAAPLATTPSNTATAAAATTPTALPPLSRYGVEDASMVGRAILSAYRGPAGFFWIVPGKLAGCAEPGVVSSIGYDLDLLARLGVNHLVTLTEKDLDQHELQRHGFRNIHLPIFDREAPSIRQTYMLLRRMQALMDAGDVVAVHCKAGIGRTGTILAAWMIREGGIDARCAIERLRTINPAYVQTVLQEQFLHEFEQDILRRT